MTLYNTTDRFLKDAMDKIELQELIFLASDISDDFGTTTFKGTILKQPAPNSLKLYNELTTLIMKNLFQDHLDTVGFPKAIEFFNIYMDDYPETATARDIILEYINQSVIRRKHLNPPVFEPCKAF